MSYLVNNVAVKQQRKIQLIDLMLNENPPAWKLKGEKKSTKESGRCSGNKQVLAESSLVMVHKPKFPSERLFHGHTGSEHAALLLL